jgi:Rnl2 family RNA ligase
MNQIYNHFPPSTLWNATEKIHGSNFSATTNGTDIKWGKRTTFLTDEEMEQFYNCHHIKPNYSAKILALFSSIQSKTTNPIKAIRVFGELCGGGYNGLKSGYEKQVKMVQPQIQYVPTIEFVIFDICIITKEKIYYMSMTDVIQECIYVDLPCVQILHTGTISELVKLDPNFVTMIPQLFNLEPIENNMAEGYVFKPCDEGKLPLGSRAILKHKSPAFGERSNKKVIIPRAIIESTLEHNRIIEHICAFINANRLNNVRSKLLVEDLNNNKKVSGLLIKDAIDDAMLEMTHDDIMFYKKERSIIMPQLNTYAIEVLHSSTINNVTVV